MTQLYTECTEKTRWWNDWTIHVSSLQIQHGNRSLHASWYSVVKGATPQLQLAWPPWISKTSIANCKPQLCYTWCWNDYGGTTLKPSLAIIFYHWATCGWKPCTSWWVIDGYRAQGRIYFSELVVNKYRFNVRFPSYVCFLKNSRRICSIYLP